MQIFMSFMLSDAMCDIIINVFTFLIMNSRYLKLSPLKIVCAASFTFMSASSNATFILYSIFHFGHAQLECFGL